MTKSTEVKELKQDDPMFLPTKMGVTEAVLAELRKEYDPANIPAKVVKGDDAYAQVHSKAMSIIKYRTGIEATRKELKADALAWGKKVDGEAKRLTAEIEAIEKPWKDAKAAADEAQERVEREEREAEQARVEAIESKVLALKVATEGLLNANSEAIKKRLDKLLAYKIDEGEFEEYYDAAVMHHSASVTGLKEALSARVDLEAEQKEMAELKAKMAADQVEIDRQKQELADLKAAQEAEEAAHLAKIDAEIKRDMARAVAVDDVREPLREKPADGFTADKPAPDVVAGIAPDNTEQQDDLWYSETQIAAAFHAIQRDLSYGGSHTITLDMLLNKLMEMYIAA